MNAQLAIPPTLADTPKIGPDSVLLMIPALDEALGNEERQKLLTRCGMGQLPSADRLMAEGPAAKLHQAVRRLYPEQAEALVRDAGRRTAERIISTRIPEAALRVLRVLPAWLAAPLLANIIEKHAWTFAGSGRFRVRCRDPLIFELTDNPVVRGERADAPVCHWHAAVFEHLFRDIVDPTLRCTETHCSAAGAHACRFDIR